MIIADHSGPTHYFTGDVTIEQVSKMFDWLAKEKDAYPENVARCNDKKMKSGKEIRKAFAKFAASSLEEQGFDDIHCSLKDSIHWNAIHAFKNVTIAHGGDGTPVVLPAQQASMRYMIDDGTAGGKDRLPVKPVMTGDDYCNMCEGKQ